MRRLVATLLLFGIPFSVAAEGTGISRRDGFLTLWRALQRPAFSVRETPFSDVPKDSNGFTEITYAKARGLLDDDEAFQPDADLLLPQALVWLLRTRNVADADMIQPLTLSGLLLKYPIVPLEDVAADSAVTEERLMALMRSLDGMLAQEEHEVSLYAEKFHGKGTAFGESFDMHAMTAAHRTFPHNTLVRVTNVANGKSVIVRINDRGPYVDGRDMDLSLGAFTAIAERSLGKIRARFERLGDATITSGCEVPTRFQERLGRKVRLQRGVPHAFPLGETLTIRANHPFVVWSVTYPDGLTNRLQDWILKDERYSFTPSLEGDYAFVLGTVDGRMRKMRMRVVSCGK